MEKMRGFLIRNFITIVFMVLVAELLIMAVFSGRLFPVLQWYFLKNVSNISISGEQTVLVLVIYLVEYLLRLLGIFL